jgi:hypothetical protein
MTEHLRRTLAALIDRVAHVALADAIAVADVHRNPLATRTVIHL